MCKQILFLPNLFLFTVNLERQQEQKSDYVVIRGINLVQKFSLRPQQQLHFG